MGKLISTMEGDEVIFNIEIDPEDEVKDWCVTVSSRSNYGGGFEIPIVSNILEYPYKAEKFCGIGSQQQIRKKYILPGQYLGVLEVGTKPASIAGPHIARFEVTGLSITDKDIKTAKELLACMSEIYDKNKQKGETVFNNMMLNPFFDALVELLENIINKRDIYPYVNSQLHNINLFGPTIEEGKYFWPTMYEGKYIPCKGR